MEPASGSCSTDDLHPSLSLLVFPPKNKLPNWFSLAFIPTKKNQHPPWFFLVRILFPWWSPPRPILPPSSRTYHQVNSLASILFRKGPLLAWFFYDIKWCGHRNHRIALFQWSFSFHQKDDPDHDDHAALWRVIDSAGEEGRLSQPLTLPLSGASSSTHQHQHPDTRHVSWFMTILIIWPPLTIASHMTMTRYYLVIVINRESRHNHYDIHWSISS